MGLVTKTYVQHTPGSRVCTEGSSSSKWEDNGSFDKTIYRRFSMQDDMKTLVYPSRVRDEFDLFLQYAEAKTLGAVSEDFDLLDAHLGLVGVYGDVCDTTTPVIPVMGA